MKRLLNLPITLVFASLVIFMSCGSGDDNPDPDIFEEATKKLTVSWSPSAVTGPGSANVQSDWKDFTLSFTGDRDGGDYTTTNVPAGFEDVWPAKGKWKFGDSTSKIDRGGLDITATITDTALTLAFTYADPNARANGLVGDWVFVFGKN